MPLQSISCVGCDALAHHVHPLGVVHDLLGDEQLAVDEAPELAEDLLHALAQRRRVQQVAAHFLVVAERGPAVDQRVVVARRAAPCAFAATYAWWKLRRNTAARLSRLPMPEPW